MIPTVAQLIDLTESYSYCPVDCDGMTRILSALLDRNNIKHTVYRGDIARSSGEGSLLHFWIELETADQGYRTLDYRIRQWFGVDGDTPHGVFDPSGYSFIYHGQPIEFSLMSSENLFILGSPITDLIACLEVLPKPLIFTMGYRQPYSEAILTFLTSRGYPIIDIRERAGSRFSSAYNRRQLQERYGPYYTHIKSLGNTNHGQEKAPVAFVNMPDGIEKGKEIVYGEAVGKGAALLCACLDWEECHRKDTAKHLVEAIPEATAVHIPAIGNLVLQRAQSRSELFMYGNEPIGPHGMFRLHYEDGYVLSTYNPALVDQLLQQQNQEGPETRKIDRSYCEIPLAELSHENCKKQGSIQTQNAKTTVSTNSEE